MLSADYSIRHSVQYVLVGVTMPKGREKYYFIGTFPINIYTDIRVENINPTVL